MAITRRDFLRNSACAVGGMALASSIETFSVVHALTPDAATDYKALVCIFLNGGNDGNNMLVSLDQYDGPAGSVVEGYLNVRNANSAGLAIPKNSLLPISPVSGGSYGFHPNMPLLQNLFNQGKLAVLCNNGPLVEPITRTTYQNGTGKKPLQLFSHSDQQGLFQTAISNTVSQSGWGGRLADKTNGLNGSATFPSNVSIAGINLLLSGVDTRQLAIPDAGTSLANVLQLNMSGTTSEQASRRASFDELRTLDNNFKLVKAASDIRTGSIQTDNTLSSLSSQTLTTIFPATSLGRQLQQVALLIKACTNPLAGINMKRQIFFTQIGGFDTHSGEIAGQANLLGQLNAAINAFFSATVELGVQDKVTTFTMSDFGRTFQPAGSSAGVGSDHAWGNHHLIVGGAVLGGTFYGTYPTLRLGGPDDTDGANPRGRWIPTTSVEQYAATLATWYGLSTADLSAVFPLIGRFNTPNLGFLS